MAELALQQVAQDETCIYCSKLVTRRFYMTRILPQTTAFFETNKAGTGADISADGNFGSYLAVRRGLGIRPKLEVNPKNWARIRTQSLKRPQLGAMPPSHET